MAKGANVLPKPLQCSVTVKLLIEEERNLKCTKYGCSVKEGLRINVMSSYGFTLMASRLSGQTSPTVAVKLWLTSNPSLTFAEKFTGFSWER